MNNSVKVTADAQGRVVIPSTNNPQFGYVRVEAIQTSMEGGWLRSSKKSALIRGKVAELEAANFKAGQSLAGKIISVETTTPAYEGQDAKINPDTKQVITSGGKPVYRDSFFTENLTATDVLLPMDKVTVGSPEPVA